ncbi:MAG: hypothetical protein WCA49_19150 [Candidatus Sulfotelmatobacter sp.]
MAKRCALVFAAFGYVLVIWYYSVYFAPLTWNFGRQLLWAMCLSCASVTGLRSGRLVMAVLYLGPINATLYGIAGFVLGRIGATKFGRSP